MDAPFSFGLGTAKRRAAQQPIIYARLKLPEALKGAYPSELCIAIRKGDDPNCIARNYALAFGMDRTTADVFATQLRTQILRTAGAQEEARRRPSSAGSQQTEVVEQPSRAQVTKELGMTSRPVAPRGRRLGRPFFGIKPFPFPS
jgi:hypothetical protein